MMMMTIADEIQGAVIGITGGGLSGGAKTFHAAMLSLNEDGTMTSRCSSSAFDRASGEIRPFRPLTVNRTGVTSAGDILTIGSTAGGTT